MFQYLVDDWDQNSRPRPNDVGVSQYLVDEWDTVSEATEAISNLDVESPHRHADLKGNKYIFFKRRGKMTPHHGLRKPFASGFERGRKSNWEQFGAKIPQKGHLKGREVGSGNNVADVLETDSDYNEHDQRVKRFGKAAAKLRSAIQKRGRRIKGAGRQPATATKSEWTPSDKLNQDQDPSIAIKPPLLRENPSNASPGHKRQRLRNENIYVDTNPEANGMNIVDELEQDEPIFCWPTRSSNMDTSDLNGRNPGFESRPLHLANGVGAPNKGRQTGTPDSCSDEMKEQILRAILQESHGRLENSPISTDAAMYGKIIEKDEIDVVEIASRTKILADEIENTTATFPGYNKVDAELLQQKETVFVLSTKLLQSFVPCNWDATILRKYWGAVHTLLTNAVG